MPDLIHVFVDNSNVWIGGKKLAGRRSRPPVPSNALYRIEYGRLLSHVQGTRPLGDVPKLYGSEPPPNDSVWKMIRQKGFDVQVFQRNIFNREKGVDMKMGLDIGKLIYTAAKPEIIGIVAGDADFIPAIQEARGLGWEIEVWYWSNAAQDLKTAANRFIDLDPALYTIGYDA